MKFNYLGLVLCTADKIMCDIFHIYIITDIVRYDQFSIVTKNLIRVENIIYLEIKFSLDIEKG